LKRDYTFNILQNDFSHNNAKPNENGNFPEISFKTKINS
jgi:hypothetical protein